MSFRIGFGYDIHSLVKGNNLILGGVSIKHEKGTKAHSDGDVLLHSLADALLGAFALGDIGEYFPNHNIQYKNAKSSDFLLEIMGKIPKNYRIINCDCTIIAEKPKLAKYRLAMRENIADFLATSLENISVKFTTNERNDSLGNENAIAVHSVVLLGK